MREHFQKLGLVEGEHFIFESFLDKDRFSDLVGLYTAADFYLELSLHEGFGMQLVEAMACGTTCITSSNGALAEISSSHAIFIDPTSVESIATALKISYETKLHLRDNHKQVLYTRKFSWDAMGQIVAGTLLKLADKNPPYEA
jgi:glycosyltransferase involved in cell wall biosynthesis